MIKISSDKDIKRKKDGDQKIIKIFIFVLMVLSAILAAVPVVLQRSHNSYSKDIIFGFQNIYIVSFIVLAIILGLLSLLFPDDFKEAGKIASKNLYNDSNLKSEVPPIVWLSILGIVVFSLLIGWIFIK